MNFRTARPQHRASSMAISHTGEIINLPPRSALPARQPLGRRTTGLYKAPASILPHVPRHDLDYLSCHVFRYQRAEGVAELAIRLRVRDLDGQVLRVTQQAAALHWR